MNKINTDECRKVRDFHLKFTYSAYIKEQVQKQKPTWKYYATMKRWEEEFGRKKRSGQVGINIKIGQNQSTWFFDISQTYGGKPVPNPLYKNLKGKVDGEKDILLVLANYSSRKITFETGVGIGEDSFVENNQIILRPGLSPVQKIFAIVREIIGTTQDSAVVIEAASYIVCQCLGIDTSDFSVGYLAEHLSFSQAKLNETDVKNKIISESVGFVNYLDVFLKLFLREDEEESGSSSQSNGGGNDLELEEQQYTSSPLGTKLDEVVADQTIEEKTVVMGDFEVKFLSLIKTSEIMNRLPDNTINIETVGRRGYTSEQMIPIGKAAALNFYNQGLPIWLLYENNEEKQVFKLSEIHKHTFYCGITEEDWITEKINRIDIALKKESEKIDTIGFPDEIVLVSKDEDISKQPEFWNITDYNVDISWLNLSLPIFLQTSGMERREIPYFSPKVLQKQNLSSISGEAHEINRLMLWYCLHGINIALDRNKNIIEKEIDGKKVKRKTYNVKKSVEDICKVYSVIHISQTFRNYAEKDIKAPSQIVKAFKEYFEIYQNQVKTKKIERKETYDEKMERLRKKQQQKSATAQTATSSGNPHNKNDKIFQVIQIYKTGNTVKKPTNDDTVSAIEQLPKVAQNKSSMSRKH